MISCDFRRLITISDKIDVGPWETLKKWNVLWEHCIDINQSSLPSGLISTWEFWQVKDLQNPIVNVLFTIFSDFFRLIKLYITCCHYELCQLLIEIRKSWRSCKKSYVSRFAIDIWSTFLITILQLLFLITMLFFSLQENTSVGTSFWIKIGLNCMRQLYLLKKTLR